MMNFNIKFIIIGFILAIILFLSGLFIGKYHFSTKEIKVITKTVTETKYKTKIKYVDNHPIFDQDNFNRLLQCYESPLKFKERTEDKYLFVTCADDCKEATAQYEIGTSGNYKLYLTFAGIGVAAGAGAIWYLKSR